MVEVWRRESVERVFSGPGETFTASSTRVLNCSVDQGSIRRHRAASSLAPVLRSPVFVASQL
jgi:hypothetical protein